MMFPQEVSAANDAANGFDDDGGGDDELNQEGITYKFDCRARIFNRLICCLPTIEHMFSFRRFCFLHFVVRDTI